VRTLVDERALYSALVGVFSLIVVLIVAFGPPLGWWGLTSWQLRRGGYRRGRPPPSTVPEHTFDPTDAWSVRCGARVGNWNATVPLAMLRFDRRWAQISSSLPFMLGIRPVWIDRSAVTAVRQLPVTLSPGISFVTPDGRYDGVVVWTFKPATILHGLRERGWPVEEATQRAEPR
jgi:hypothetical protein